MQTTDTRRRNLTVPDRKSRTIDVINVASAIGLIAVLGYLYWQVSTVLGSLS